MEACHSASSLLDPATASSSLESTAGVPADAFLLPALIVQPLLTGGCYKLELFLPEEYPMAPPKVSANASSPSENLVIRWCVRPLGDRMARPVLEAHEGLAEGAQAPGINNEEVGIQTRMCTAGPLLDEDLSSQHR